MPTERHAQLIWSGMARWPVPGAMKVFFVAPQGVGGGRGGICLNVFVCHFTTEPQYVLFLRYGHFLDGLLETFYVPKFKGRGLCVLCVMECKGIK